MNFVLNAADLKTLKGQKITQLIASDGESNLFLIDSSDSNGGLDPVVWSV